jgi:AcrR family transcriptional regulator
LVQRGYERATLAEIAGRAGLHLQTLIRHFPTKAELMAAIHVATLRRFEAYFAQREGSALQSWRDWVELNAKNAPAVFAFPNDTYRFPVITPQGQEAMFRTKELLADGLAQDLGVDRDSDLRPTLIACMLTAGNAHVAQGWAGQRFNKAKFVASLLGVVDTAEAMLAKEYPKRRVA